MAPTVNRVAEYVPRRRDRKLHVGLFGYSREVGEIELPRAITYTAALYSVGFPPTLMGLSGLADGDWTVVGTLQTPLACRRMYGTSGSPRDNERPYSSGTD